MFRFWTKALVEVWKPYEDRGKDKSKTKKKTVTEKKSTVSEEKQQTTKKRGGYFKCDGPHLAKDCPHKEKVNAIIAGLAGPARAHSFLQKKAKQAKKR